VQYGYDAHVEMVGTRGVIHVGRSDGDFVKVTTPENGTAGSFVSSWTALFEDAYLREDISFAEAVLNDAEVLVTGRDGLEAVKVVEAGNRSILSREIVKL